MTYILRPGGPGSRVEMAELLTVEHSEIYRDSGRRIAGIRVMSPTGRRNRNELLITAYPAPGFHVRTERAAIRRKIRKLRAQEAAQIESLDAQIDELRRQRRELVKAAWERANVVTLKELEELAGDK